MKFKNIHFAMRHFEKIVLGVAALYLLVVGWLFVFGSPYTATLGQERGVRPDQVEKRVLEQADRLKSKINDPTSPLPEISLPPYTAMFRQRVDRAPLATASLDPIAKPGLSGPFVFEEPRVKIYAVPQPPAPSLASARAAFGVLPPQDELAERYAAARTRDLGRAAAERVGKQVAAELGYLVPANVPRDFRYVTVAGVYDLDAWRTRLREPGGVPIPEPWWRNMLLITDVLLERQTLDADTGQWSEAKLIDPLPGGYTLRRAPDTWLSNEAQEVVRDVQDHQDRITRPDFVPMTDAATWVPPDLPSASGVDAAADARTPAAAGEHAEAAITPAFQPDLTASLRTPLWGHDLTVVPGRTYRYRLTARVFNPLFQRRTLAEEQRDKYFQALWLQSEPSAWSDPVTIDPEQQFFVIEIAARRQAATIEAWRIFNAQPYSVRFSAGPGDPIGGTFTMPMADQGVSVTMDLGAVMVDLIAPRLSGTLGGRASRVIYLNTKTNQLIERAVDQDRDSPARLRLLEIAPSAAVDVSGG